MPYSDMPSDATYPSRRRQRLPSYDYSSPGSYFITLCIRDRLPLLGQVQAGEMRRSPAGDRIAQLWKEIPDRYTGVTLDTLMVMPDHAHAILCLDGEGLSLSEIMHHLKSRTTAQYALGVREQGWPRSPGRCGSGGSMTG